MAAVQRTRPLRPAQASSRPPPASAGRVPLQRQASPTKPIEAPTSTTSPLATYLTNLRLLNLDQLPDWPQPSATIFAASGPLGHKRRLQCVEWTLYRLFEIYDPEETASKLASFFPPTQQLHSVNLRAALFKLLENAKRSGAIGRDAILRKTMLEDCKGERLEEVLASFSSAVLRKVAMDDLLAGKEHLSPALDMALDNYGGQGDTSMIRPLIVAYRGSLTKMLEQRQVAKTRCHDFQELLSIKERGLARRMESVEERTSRESFGRMSEGERKDMRRTLGNSWTGNEAWIDTLLYGNEAAKNRNGLLATPFDRIWNRVQQGRLAEVEDDGKGLLYQLESRVKAQEDRFVRWNAFHKDMAYDKVLPSPSKRRAPIPKKQGIELRFEAHKDLQVGNMRSTRTSLRQEVEPDPEYEQIVEQLKQELHPPPLVTAKDILGPIIQRQRRESYLVPDLFADNPISDISDLEDEPELPELPKELLSLPKQPLKAAKRLPRRPVMQPRKPSGDAGRNLTARGSARDLREEYSRKASFEVPKPAPKPEPKLVPVYNEAARSLDQYDGSDRQSSSPSPTKKSKPRHTLSLAERTRLSMARHSVSFDEDELPAGQSPPKPTVQPIREVSPDEPDAEDAYTDLVSRTRKSMAGFDKAQQKAQMERRRSVRRSKILPQREVVPIPKVDEEDYTARIERLMKDGNMDAIFGPKSRS